MNSDEFIKKFNTFPFKSKGQHPLPEVSKPLSYPEYNSDVFYTEYKPVSGGTEVKTIYKDGHIENSVITSEEFLKKFSTPRSMYAADYSGADNNSQNGADFKEEQYQQFKKELFE